MSILAEVKILYVQIILTSGLYALPRPPTTEGLLNLSIDSILTMVRDSVTRPCESMKSFLGLSYDQVQQNVTWITNSLYLDEITTGGTLKHSLTAKRKLAELMKQADTIVIVINGYLENSEGAMVSLIGPALLSKPRFKVFALDGRKVIGIEYLKSTTNARLVGEALGNVLVDLKRDGINMSSVTLVGHSLGSHIAGAVGKQVKRSTGEMIGRIIALDPAGPCFSGNPIEGRIDRSDATYVEAIHTNAGALGFPNSVGHRDFYPNGGKHQPGCALSTCSHSRAWLYFAESIKDPFNFPSVRCESWEKYLRGGCASNRIAYMGMNFDDVRQMTGNRSNIVPGSYYFFTAASPPFGIGLNGTKALI